MCRGLGIGMMGALLGRWKMKPWAWTICQPRCHRGFCTLGAIRASERGDQPIPRKTGTEEAFCQKWAWGRSPRFQQRNELRVCTAARSVRKAETLAPGATTSARSEASHKLLFSATRRTLWKHNCLLKASMETLLEASDGRERGHKGAIWRWVGLGAGLPVSWAGSGSKKSLLLVTATPVTNAAPLTPRPPQAFSGLNGNGLSRPVCSHSHFWTYSRGSWEKNGTHAGAAGTCPPTSALCLLIPLNARRPSKIL